jgi:hypothetical protein
MYEHVFDNMRRATETALQVQQEMFRTWLNYWPGAASATVWPIQIQAFQKKWADTFGDVLKKQQEALETQFKAGLKMIEESVGVTTARDPEDLRAKLSEYWKKSFEGLRQIGEAQMQAFQSAVAKWADLAAKPAG